MLQLFGGWRGCSLVFPFLIVLDLFLLSLLLELLLFILLLLLQFLLFILLPPLPIPKLALSV
jgi:hypothetical protein